MKRLAFVFATIAAPCAFATMEPATPESQGVSSEAILDWIDACENTFDGGTNGALHGFVIVRHGKVIAEGSWKPFDTLNEEHMLYSHSKSFTSSAIGFLVDEGKLDLDERVVDIFTNERPAVVSKNLAQLRVRDLLTMNVGKRDHLLHGDGSWVANFLSQEFSQEPGTCFKYDSDATYMLAAIAEKRTDMPMLSYLMWKMFDKIGIKEAWTTHSPQGIACGGWGMSMTTREMARFGQLYLQKGVWNGEQILSSEWVALATARQTWCNGITIQSQTIGSGSDWNQGYGFQFWRCRHGAYRADGAAGQLTVVMPEQDAVVSIHAGLGDMQKELDLVWKHLLPAMKDAPLPEDAAAQAKLTERLENLELKPVECQIKVDDTALPFGKTFEFKDNPRGFKSVWLGFGTRGPFPVLHLTMQTRAGEQWVTVGLGRWEKNSMRIDVEDYCEVLGAYIGELTTAASGGMQKDGTIRIRIYLTGTPGHIDLAFTGGKVTGEFWAMRGCKLESK